MPVLSTRLRASALSLISLVLLALASPAFLTAQDTGKVRDVHRVQREPAAGVPCEEECLPTVAVFVTPDGTTAPVRRTGSGGHSERFEVRNAGGAETRFKLQCTSSGGVSCGSLSETDITLGVGVTTEVDVPYSVSAAGTGHLALHARALVAGQGGAAPGVAMGASGGSGAEADSGYYRISVQDPRVDVRPDGATTYALNWGWHTELFSLRNVGNGTQGFNLSVVCSGAALACSVSETRLVLGRGWEEAVEVRFYKVGAPFFPETGTVVLNAQPDAGVGDVGSMTVKRGNKGAPTAALDEVNPGKAVARELCLSFPAGAAASYECGDLRVVHPLPSVQSLSKTHTPALVYNSQHAHPYPLVSAQVQLPDGVVRPDAVEAILEVEGVERARGSWDGDDWRSEREAGITLGFDGLNDPTGVYEYTLEVATVYGGDRFPSTSEGTLVIVNRSDSPFGAGWWLAGLEELVFGSGNILWIGGDGSARVYDQVVRSGVLAAPPVDRPDTLTLAVENNALIVTRHLLHGRKVRFNSAGQHVATIDRLGHETSFAYDSEGRLESSTLPPTGSSLTYTFQYGSLGTLQAVRAPGPGQGSPSAPVRVFGSGPEPEPATRTTVVNVLNGRLQNIADPDDTGVLFGYSPSFTHRMRSYTDRRGVATTFSYDAGSKLRSATVDMGSADPDITMGYRALEAMGLPGSDFPAAVRERNAYTLLDEPRTDMGDSTLHWLDRFGATRKLRDPLGHETLSTRGDARWPALATRIEHPNGKVVGISYDDHGNILTLTDSSTYLVDGGKRLYATTRYEWDRKWDYATVVVPPERDSTVSTYDPTTGNRLWVQDARGSGTRVEYGYNSLGLSESVDGPDDAPPLLTRYDALGNVSETETPSGAVARHHRDAIGRDTLIVTPIDTDGQFSKRRRILYDIMGRDTLVQVIALRRPGLGSETDTLTVRKSYDAQGNLVRHERTVAPDKSEIGSVVNEWEYDRAGRLSARIAPDGERETMVYDPAGNPIERHTRRGHVIKRKYNAAGQLIERFTPTVVYDEWRAVTPRGEPIADFSLPRYTEGFIVPADKATYSYDEQGNLLAADNKYAKIRRTYNKNGTLATDELRIRTYPSGGDFDTHVYRMEYDYDLNGRTVEIRHPESLAPVLNGARKDVVEYRYDEAGQLHEIVDLLGNVVRYEYDASARLEHIDHAGGVDEDVTYDDDGRILTRKVRTFHGSSGFDNGIIHDDVVTYDGRDKIVHVEAHDGSSTQAYAGLGPLRHSSNNRLAQPFWSETFIIDGLGNRTQMSKEPRNGSVFSTIRSLEYAPGSGRLWVVKHPFLDLSNQLPFLAEYTYDESGNEEHYTRFPCPAEDPCFGNIPAVLMHARKGYYDAGEQLVAVDKHVCAWLLAESRCVFPTVPFSERNVFEEHRYDALGRRVLSRARYDEGCPFCDSYIQRTVWDGDQVLYEVRYPGGDDVSESELERDTGPAYTKYNSYGRVAYTHGPGIDRPVSIVRMDYDATWPNPVTVFPHSDWSGVYDVGHFDDGSGKRCKNPFDQDTCVIVDWPGAREGMFLELPLSSVFPPKSWFGNVITRNRDASGWMYRRNRYYDPGTGRFTQEDPIGLNGGIDVYRYAGGDPVNFSDPFGLDEGFPIYYAPPIVVTAPRYSPPWWDVTNSALPDRTGVAVQPPPRQQIDLFPPSFWHSLGLPDPDRKRGPAFRNGDNFRRMTKGEARIQRILLNRYLEQILEPSVIVNDPRLPTSTRLQNHLDNAVRVLGGAAGAGVQGPGSAAAAGAGSSPYLQGVSRGEIEATLDYLKSIENQ